MALAETSSTSLVDRMMRAARLDSRLYDEVDADPTATSQAWTVVIITAVATAIGAAIGAGITGGNLGAGIISGLLTDILGWVVFTFVMTWVGNTLLGGHVTYTRMLRSLGFAYSPGVLNIFSFIPVLGGIIGLIVGIWRLVTSFIAVREGLGFDNGKTIATIVVGLVAYLIVIAIVGAILVAIFGAGYAIGNMAA